MAGDKVDDGIPGGPKEGTTVIQRVVREVGVGTAFPMLTKNNYSGWAHSLWVTVDKGGVDL
jgi:hypothetical protein